MAWRGFIQVEQRPAVTWWSGSNDGYGDQSHNEPSYSCDEIAMTV